MCVGVLMGIKFFPEKWTQGNLRFQLVCTSLLIFSMGVSLGARENFLEEISKIGLESLVIALLAIAFSVVFVYLFTKKWKQ